MTFTEAQASLIAAASWRELDALYRAQLANPPIDEIRAATAELRGEAWWRTRFHWMRIAAEVGDEFPADLMAWLEERPDHETDLELANRVGWQVNWEVYEEKREAGADPVELIGLLMGAPSAPDLAAYTRMLEEVCVHADRVSEPQIAMALAGAHAALAHLKGDRERLVAIEPALRMRGWLLLAAQTYRDREVAFGRELAKQCVLTPDDGFFAAQWGAGGAPFLELWYELVIDPLPLVTEIAIAMSEGEYALSDEDTGYAAMMRRTMIAPVTFLGVDTARGVFYGPFAETPAGRFKWLGKMNMAPGISPEEMFELARDGKTAGFVPAARTEEELRRWVEASAR